ncbi:alkaline protease [Acinetobacter haemolyticus]|nr:alkaline protease [Acinetobacter haemolyticus]
MKNKTLLLLSLCILYSTNTTAAALSAAQLKQQLNSTALAKVAKGKIDLNALVNNESK